MENKIYNMNLFLNKTIYDSSNLSMYGLSTYTSLMSLISNKDNYEVCITYEVLCYQLTKTINNPRRFVDSIKAGLDELYSMSYIIKKEENKKCFVFDCSKLFVNTNKDFFTIITFEEVQKIFQVKNVNNFLLLRYFIYLIGTISSSIDVWLDAVQHKTRVVGILTIDYISRLTGISERKIIDYNKVLENIGLLYIYRQNDFLLSESGKITQLPNVYGRLCDKIYIDSFALNQQKFKGSYKYVNKNIKNTNNKRKLAQMYNQLSIGRGENYTIDEIFEIYEYVIAENKKYENMYNKNNHDEYLEKIRDISVFNKYELIKDKEVK